MKEGDKMKMIDQSWEWMQKPPANTMQIIEKAGRTCYKSEDKITEDSAQKFVEMILKSGHHSVIEHVTASIKLITNRGVTHELVRHRIAAYSQESTRYVRYDGNMEFIKHVWWDQWSKLQQNIFINSCQDDEITYCTLLENGSMPEQAREVLPNALKTEIVMSCNLREWMHVFNLRCSKKAHPQIRELMKSVLRGFYEEMPVLFRDLYYKYILEDEK